MATLCTELGMPKYRENKKKGKRFLPGNIPANIYRTQCLVRVWKCLRALQYAPPARMAARPLLDVEGCIFACASVYTIRKRACLYDSFWVLQACAASRGCFLCTSKASSPHFLRISHPQSYADAPVHKVFFTHTPIASSSSAYLQVWVDLLACVRVHVHSSNMSLWWAMAAVATSPSSPSFCLYMPPSCHKEAHHISHGWIDPRRAQNIFHSSATSL